MASLVAQMVKNLTTMWETWVPYLSQEDPLEEEMATHPSILAWRILWTEEPGGLQSTGSQRVGHDWVTNTFTLSIIHNHPLQSIPNYFKAPVISTASSPWLVTIISSQSATHLHDKTSFSCLKIAFIEPLSTSKPSSVCLQPRAALSNIAVSGHSPLAQHCWKC